MGFSPFGGFGLMSMVIPVIVVLGFFLVFGLIIFALIRGGAQWSKNNNSPVLTVSARIVAKRAAVSNHTHHHGGGMSMHGAYSSTAYYVTFEVESRDRMELRVPDREYGLLAEGDTGRLTFQGTRFKGFERDQYE